MNMTPGINIIKIETAWQIPRHLETITSLPLVVMVVVVAARVVVAAVVVVVAVV